MCQRHYWSVFRALPQKQHKAHDISFLLRDTHGPSVTAGGLGVLTTGPKSPVVPETPVEAHLLHALKVLTKARIQHVGSVVQVLSFLVVLLSVEEPRRDHDICRRADDGDDLVDFIVGEFTSPFANINTRNLANNGGHTAPDTSDCRKRDCHFLPSINVGVEDTKDVLELVGSCDLNRHRS